MKRYVYSTESADDSYSYNQLHIAHTTSDPNVLAKLADNDNEDVRKEVARRTEDPNVLAKLADDESSTVRYLAALKITDPDIVAKLAADEDSFVRTGVVMKTNDKDLLLKLANDPDGNVRAGAMSRLLKLEDKSNKGGKKLSTWKSVINQLDADLSECDPFYEQTEAAEQVQLIQEQVEDELGIWFEPSVQAGVGGIWIYSVDDDSVLAGNIDYQDFNNTVADLAINSKSKSDFKKKYKSFVRELINE